MIRLFMILALLWATPLWAGANVGDTLPHSLAIGEQTSNKKGFDQLKGEKGAILVFVRSIDWCPFCKKQLKELNESANKITDKGYNLVAISYDSAAKQTAFREGNQISYPLLSDPDSTLIKAFGILNTKMKEGTRFYGVPHPTIYVVDQEGIIRSVLAEEGYKDRPSIEAVLEAL